MIRSDLSVKRLKLLMHHIYDCYLASNSQGVLAKASLSILIWDIFSNRAGSEDNFLIALPTRFLGLDMELEAL